MNKGRDGTATPAAVVANSASAPGRSSVGPGSSARNARAATLSGITFAVLFTAGLVLINRIPRLGSPDNTYATFYSTGAGGVLVTVGLYVVPFAGIAFLWFMMLVTTTTQSAALLVYPAWVLLVSLALFRRASTRPGRPAEGARAPAITRPRFGRGSRDRIT